MTKQATGFTHALGEMAQALNSGLAANGKLQLILKSTALALGVRGCSLLLLDAQKKRLVHTASHGLSERYLHKGFLDAEKSLPEVLEGQTVAISDTSTDPRVQFREPARQEQITSVLAVPLKIKGEVVGSLRVYSRTPREFTTAESNFLSTAANLAAIVLENGHAAPAEGPAVEGAAPRPAPAASKVKPASFAHPSEEEFARLLDFYEIEWLYEPRSFPLQWEDRKTTEMFTPDFYLPSLDLYIEMTTMKPGLAREKNRKMRRIRELFPEVNIKLLARRDYDRLLAKYGYGPLAGPKTRGVGKVLFSSAVIQRNVNRMAKEISRDYAGRQVVLVGVLRGVVCFMADLMRDLTIPVELDFMSLSYFKSQGGKAVRITKDLDVDLSGRHVVLVEDIVDTGMTLRYILDHLKARGPESLAVCTLLDKRVRRIIEVPLNYVGFEVPDEFLVGYGLDYQEEYRNLPFIALLREEEPEAKRGKKRPRVTSLASETLPAPSVPLVTYSFPRLQNRASFG